MWTPELVRARFHEAADTERFLPMMKLNNGAGYWPIYIYTQEDREGWDDAAKIDNADRWAWRRKLTREAISRHDECLDWSITILTEERHRHIVWKWAFCQAYGRSFSEVCRRKGWVRMTAYRRLDACFVKICDHVLGNDTLPRPPDSRFMLQESDFRGTESVEYENSASAIPLTRSYRTEPSRHLLDTPEKISEFEKMLARRNARLQKTKQRREQGAA